MAKSNINLSDYEFGLVDMFDAAMHAEAERKNNNWTSRNSSREAAIKGDSTITKIMSFVSGFSGRGRDDGDHDLDVMERIEGRRTPAPAPK